MTLYCTELYLCVVIDSYALFVGREAIVVSPNKVMHQQVPCVYKVYNKPRRNVESSP